MSEKSLWNVLRAGAWVLAFGALAVAPAVAQEETPPAEEPADEEKAEEADDKFTEVMADPAVEKRALASLQAKLEPFTKEIAASSLPEVDPDDCVALARRLIELRQEGPSKASIGRTLAHSFIPCGTLLPKHVANCLPTPAKPATVEAYDACVAKGAGR